MPVFEVVPVQEAMRRATTSKRAQIIQEYVDYIDKLSAGQAGKLLPAEGETVLTIRRRLNTAAKQSGKNLKVNRVGDEIYFWVQEGAARRRRGRPPKAERAAQTGP